MRRRPLMLVPALAAGMLVGSAVPDAPAASGTDRLIVTTTPGAHVRGSRPLTRDGSIRVVDVPAAAFRARARSLRATPGVVAIERDRRLRFVTANGYATDPLAPDQWALSAVNWHTAATTGATPPVAVLDSGVAVNHPDLVDVLADGSPRLSGTWNAMNAGTDVTDNVGHGTAATSIVAAATNNTEGIAGISPNTPLVAVKVGDVDGVMLADAIAGISWATDNGARVINMSFAAEAPSHAFRTAVLRAADRGVVMVAAVGNEGCLADGFGNHLQYPAGFGHVVGVGATDRTGRVACFSNWGPEVDLVAPGVSVTGAVPAGSRYLQSFTGYRVLSGTSFAAPVVTAAAAQVVARNPAWKPAQVRIALQRSARDLGVRGRDDHAGSGLLDLAATLARSDAPAPDDREVDDDVAFAQGKRAALAGTGIARRVISSRLDRANDPHDLYSISLRRGQRVDATATFPGGRRVHLNLWKPGTLSIHTSPARTFVAARAVVGTSSSALRFTAPASGTYYLHASTPAGSLAYSLAVARR